MQTYRAIFFVMECAGIIITILRFTESFVHRLQRNLPLTTEAVNALLAGRLTMSLTVKRIFFTQKAIQRHSANFCRRNMAPWIH